MQEQHVNDASEFFKTLGYMGYWSCSIEKKGYSGTVTTLIAYSSPITTLLTIFTQAILCRTSTVKLPSNLADVVVSSSTDTEIEKAPTSTGL